MSTLIFGTGAVVLVMHHAGEAQVTLACGEGLGQHNPSRTCCPDQQLRVGTRGVLPLHRSGSASPLRLPAPGPLPALPALRPAQDVRGAAMAAVDIRGRPGARAALGARSPRLRGPARRPGLSSARGAEPSAGRPQEGGSVWCCAGPWKLERPGGKAAQKAAVLDTRQAGSVCLGPLGENKLPSGRLCLFRADKEVLR